MTGLQEDVSRRSSRSFQNSPRVTKHCAWSCLFAALVGLWPYGYSVGSINAAYDPIIEDISRIYSERQGVTVPPELLSAIWVIISVAFPIGGIFGSLLTEPIVSRLGRLCGMLVCHIGLIFFATVLGLSKVFESPEIIVICRFGIGILVSALTGICVMYVLEVSPQPARGIFGTMVSFAINLGVLLANAIGIPEILGSERLWPLFLALVGFPSILFVLLMRTLPESPRELYVEKGNKDKAALILRRLNGTEDVDQILANLEKEREDFASCSRLTIPQLLQTNSLRFSLLVALVLAASQQITGLSCIAFNMNEIYLQAGISEAHVYFASIAVFGTVVGIHGITIPLIDRKGRKPLLICGYFMQAFSLIVLTASIQLKSLSDIFSYVSVVASMGFWVGFSVGPGPVTLVVVGELFEQSSRSAAVALSSVALWLGMAITASTGPYLLMWIDGYTFVLYAALSFAAMSFVIFKVPETKNRPFSEIQAILTAGIKTAPSTIYMVSDLETVCHSNQKFHQQLQADLPIPVTEP